MYEIVTRTHHIAFPYISLCRSYLRQCHDIGYKLCVLPSPGDATALLLDVFNLGTNVDSRHLLEKDLILHGGIRPGLCQHAGSPHGRGRPGLKTLIIVCFMTGIKKQCQLLKGFSHGISWIFSHDVHDFLMDMF